METAKVIKTLIRTFVGDNLEADRFSVISAACFEAYQNPAAFYEDEYQEKVELFEFCKKNYPQYQLQTMNTLALQDCLLWHLDSHYAWCEHIETLHDELQMLFEEGAVEDLPLDIEFEPDTYFQWLAEEFKHNNLPYALFELPISDEELLQIVPIHHKNAAAFEQACRTLSLVINRIV